MVKELTSKDKYTPLYNFIDNNKTAMLTTIDKELSINTRAMLILKREIGFHFWFICNKDNNTWEDIGVNNKVTMSIFDTKTEDYAIIRGEAIKREDRTGIEELWSKDLKVRLNYYI